MQDLELAIYYIQGASVHSACATCTYLPYVYIYGYYNMLIMLVGITVLH